jgi:hypothetical protein
MATVAPGAADDTPDGLTVPPPAALTDTLRVLVICVKLAVMVAAAVRVAEAQLAAEFETAAPAPAVHDLKLYPAAGVAVIVKGCPQPTADVPKDGEVVPEPLTAMVKTNGVGIKLAVITASAARVAVVLADDALATEAPALAVQEPNAWFACGVAVIVKGCP